MKSLLFLPAIALVSLTISCGNSTENQKSDTTAVQQTNEPSLQEKQQKATFIMDTQFDSMDVPHTTVSVEYNDTRTSLDPMICSPTVYGKQEMKEMECPENTIAAIGGWFAGGGDYYYIVPTATGIAVYKGYLDEGDDTPGYHWQLFKDIK